MKCFSEKCLYASPCPHVFPLVLTNFLQDEAAAGRQRISQSAENLNLQYRHDPDVSPPYTYNQITETARHREILTIYRNASPETGSFYERGQFFEGANEENWIIRWCLYHSFRYTDNRNRTRSRGRKLMSQRSNSSDGMDDEEQNNTRTSPIQPQSGKSFCDGLTSSLMCILLYFS